jgi:general secretion pathway protein D
MISSRRKHFRKLHWLVAVTLVAGCESPPPAILEPLSQPGALQSAPPRVNSAIAADRRKPIFEDRGTSGARSAASRGLAGAPPTKREGGDEVTLKFADTDIREIARVILGTTLKLSFTIDPAVHGTATLDATALPRDQLLPTLEVLLNQNGATLVRRGDLYAVAPIGGAGSNSLIGVNGFGAGSQVVPLRYASAKDLAKVLEPYVGEGNKLVADPNRNALVVTGDAAARQTLLELIRSFDTDVLAGQSFLILPSSDADTAKVAASLEKALRAEAEGPLASLVRVVPLPRVNAVLVASSQPRYLDAARRLYRLTSRAEAATTRSWHVYYVQNGQSADLENVLQRAFTPRNVTPSAAPGSTAPGAETQRLGTGGGFAGANQRGGVGGAATGGGGSVGLGSGLTSPSGAASTSGALASALTGPATTSAAATEPLSRETGGGDDENRIRIIANRRNNALLIYATPSEYSVIEGMLRKIDIIPLQVLINATIAEVTLNDNLQYGTQFFFKLDHVAETLGALPAFPPTPLSPTGLVGFAISKTPNFILRALSDVTQVKVLSAPQLLVMDNEPAQLQVGQQVPVLTGTATSTLTTGAPIVNSVDYHSTGVIMQVTPRINSGGLVTLDIAQEVSNVAAPAANTATGSPTFDDRVVRTRVAAQNGQTVVLAGLIRDSSQDDNNGIPFLKDIPLLGTMLSSQSSSRSRTELLVLITPQVVHDQRDARALTEDLRRQLINAAVLPSELNRKPVRGSPNPHGL